MFYNGALHAILSHFPPQSRAGNPKGPGRLGRVSGEVNEHPPDVLRLELAQRQRFRIRERVSIAEEANGRLPKRRRKIEVRDLTVLRQGHRSLDRVLQFPNVPRIIVLKQVELRLLAEAVDALLQLSGVALPKEIRE